MEAFDYFVFATGGFDDFGVCLGYYTLNPNHF